MVLVYDINLSMEQRLTNPQDVAAHSERLKFITENFLRLQGLGTAAIGVWLFFVEIGDIRNLPVWMTLLTAPAYLVGAMLYIKLIDRLPKYYEKRFGRVEPKASGNILLQAAIFILFFVGLFIWGSKLEVGVSRAENWIHQTMPTATGILPLVLWIIGLAHSLGKRMRFDPYCLYFYCLGTLVTCAVAFCPAWYPGVRGILLWRVLSAGWLGLTLIAMGVYDHFLLVRLMPTHGGDDDDEC